MMSGDRCLMEDVMGGVQSVDDLTVVINRSLRAGLCIGDSGAPKTRRMLGETLQS